MPLGIVLASELVVVPGGAVAASVQRDFRPRGAARGYAAPVDQTGGRDTANDGRANKLELLLTTRGAPVWNVIQAVPPVHSAVNKCSRTWRS